MIPLNYFSYYSFRANKVEHSEIGRQQQMETFNYYVSQVVAKHELNAHGTQFH